MEEVGIMKTITQTTRHISLLIGMAFAIMAAVPTVQATGEMEQTWRVARISTIEGSASVRYAGENEWSEATINKPLMAGDRFYTGLDGRVEIQLEDEIFIWLGSDTLVEFAFLEDRFSRIEVLKGVVTVRAKDVPYQRAPLEILSTYFLATVDDPVRARFNVSETGESEIWGQAGVLKVNRDSSNFIRVNRGERLIVTNPNPDTYSKLPLPAEDHFDRWVEGREAAAAAAIISSNYVNPRVAGYRDLDRHGDWVEVRDYGRVWRPHVTTVGWAPYRDGYWAWRDHTGWVWVSYEPWGWVPYHYGRWVHVSNSWYWVPTQQVYVYRSAPVRTARITYVYQRPVWYPALVSFTYARRGTYFSFSTASYSSRFYHDPCIGWFPLGPRDPFYWGWGSYRNNYYYRGDTIIDNRTIVNNITNNNTIINNYQNINAPNALTVMPERDMQSGVYERRTPATLSPTSDMRDVQIGHNALASLPAPRSVETRAALASSAGVSPARVAADNARNDGAVEAARAVATKPQRLTTPSARPALTEENAERRVARAAIDQRSVVSPARVASSESRETPSVATAPQRNAETSSARANPESGAISAERSAQPQAAQAAARSSQERDVTALPRTAVEPQRNAAAPMTGQSAARQPSMAERSAVASPGASPARVAPNASVDRSAASAPRSISGFESAQPRAQTSAPLVNERERATAAPARQALPEPSAMNDARLRSSIETSMPRAQTPPPSAREALAAQQYLAPSRAQGPTQAMPRATAPSSADRAPVAAQPQSAVQPRTQNAAPRAAEPQRAAPQTRGTYIIGGGNTASDDRTISAPRPSFPSGGTSSTLSQPRTFAPMQNVSPQRSAPAATQRQTITPSYAQPSSPSVSPQRSAPTQQSISPQRSAPAAPAQQSIAPQASAPTRQSVAPPRSANSGQRAVQQMQSSRNRN